MPDLRIRLLGKFSLTCDGQPVATVNTPRLQSLLAYLVIHRDAPQPRRQIAFCLWPDLPETRARANLRKLFHQLQQALPHASVVLQAGTSTLQWQPAAPCTIDVAEFETLAASPGSLVQAIEMYSGDLLPDCYDDWIVPERGRLKQLYLETLDQLIQHKEEAHEYAAGLSFIQRLLQCDPLREDIHRRLMRLHILNGDRAAALHAFQNCVTLLNRELGVEPSLATRQLYEGLLDDKDRLVKPLRLAGSLPLVGRAAEWAGMQDAWRMAASGQPRVVLISGEAGIGKTRLAEELVVWVDRQGLPIASTFCYAAEGALAYAPVTAWLRERPLAHLEPVWLAEVARLAPELAGRGSGAPPAGPLTEPWQRQRFREALARGVLGPDLASTSPLLLLIEDLQWCDCDTLEWLHYLVRFNPQARLLVLATLRSEASRRDCALSTLLSDLTRQNLLARIDLGPLNQAETTLLGKRVMGHDVDAEIAGCLYRETEGNPLFVVEFARAGMIAPAAAGPQGPAVLPALVQAAVSSRLDQLSPSARQAIEMAAVIGREFTFEVLARAGGQEEETLVQALDELWQRRVIREQGRDAYDFSHDKLRQVVYASLSNTRRWRLHRRVAEALAQVHARHVESVSGQIGWHYEQAGDDELAAVWLQQATIAALQVGGCAEALDYINRALNLVPESNLARRYDLVMARERIYNQQATRETQGRDLAELEALAAALDDPCKQAQVAIRLGHYAIEVSDVPIAIQATRSAVHWIAQARARSRQRGRDRELAGLEFGAMYLWSKALGFQGQLAQAEAKAQQALALARAAGLRLEEARALSLLADAVINRVEARAYLEAALDIYRQVDDKMGEAFCLQLLGYNLVHLGEYGSVVTCYEQALDLARQIGYRRAEVDSMFLLGCFYNQVSDYDQGLRYLDQSWQMASADGNQRRAAYCLFNRAVSELNLGQANVALDHARDALIICQAIGDGNAQAIAWSIIGSILGHLGRWPEAADAYRHALSLVQGKSDQATAHTYRAELAHALLRQGDAQRARSLVDEVLGYAAGGGDLACTERGPAPAYLYCYKVLYALGDPRARHVLETGHALLQDRAARIQDEALRRSFLERKPENRELVAAWQQRPNRN